MTHNSPSATHDRLDRVRAGIQALATQYPALTDELGAIDATLNIVEESLPLLTLDTETVRFVFGLAANMYNNGRFATPETAAKAAVTMYQTVRDGVAA